MARAVRRGVSGCSRRETLREEPKQKRSGGGVDNFGPSVLDSSVIRRVFVGVTPVFLSQ
jgi:hypothetical protein